MNRRRFLSQSSMTVKTTCFALTILVVSTLRLGQSIPQFEDVFEDKTLRIDYYHTANADEGAVCVDQIHFSGVWAGNPRQLPVSENGWSTITVFELQRSKLLYSNHMLTIVFEYKGTEEARKGIRKTFHRTARLPWPKRPVRVVLKQRDLDNRLHTIFDVAAHSRRSCACQQQQTRSRDAPADQCIG